MSRMGRSNTIIPKSCSPKLTRFKERIRRRFSLPERNDIATTRISKSFWGSFKKTIFSGNIEVRGQDHGGFQIEVEDTMSSDAEDCMKYGSGKLKARRILSSVNDENLLHFAVTENDVDLLERILHAGKVDVNHKRPPGVAPIHQACVLGHTECVKLLTEAGADLSIEDCHGRSPIKLAVTHGHYELAELLLQNGSTIQDIRDGFQTERRPKMKEVKNLQIMKAPFGNTLQVPNMVW